MQLDHVLEFKHLGCIFGPIKYRSGRRVPGTIRSLVNAKGLQFECAKVLHETLLMPTLMYSNETLLEERGKVEDWGCPDGQPHRFARYQKNG